MADPNLPPADPPNPLPPPPVAGQVDVGAALMAIAAALNSFNNNNAAVMAALTAGGIGAAGAAGGGAPIINPIINPHLDPIFQPTAFDLSSRAGSTAYLRACEKLDETWNGAVEKFPAFVLALRIRADEFNWDAPAPHGIIRFPHHADNTITLNLLVDYHRITHADINAANTNRTNDRAKQNSTALYRALKQSIDGDLKSTLFQQIGNLPSTEDGVALFFRLTQLTVTSSLQLSMISLQSILTFAPADYNFNVSSINTQLNHLFVLATTRDRQLSEGERLQHTLTAYSRILQPDDWASWIKPLRELFDNQSVVSPFPYVTSQDLMNAGVVKYTKITNESHGTFGGSSNSIRDDIVAQLSQGITAAKRKANPTKRDDKPADSSDPDDSAQEQPKKVPPFVRHYKSSNKPDATKYKVGDSKVWKGETWYFCDCPTHRFRHKWHTHTAASCDTRTNWLAQKGTNPTANAASVPSSVDTATTSASEPSSVTSAPDLAGLLASALSLAGNNSLTRDFIADALGSL